MGEREDILRRFAERVRDGRWAVDTGYKSVHQAARAALRDAEACPPDDAQQRYRDAVESISRLDVLSSHRRVSELAVERAKAAIAEAAACPPDDAQQRRPWATRGESELADKLVDAQQRLDQIRDLAEEAKGPRGAPLTALGRIARLARGGYKS